MYVFIETYLYPCASPLVPSFIHHLTRHRLLPQLLCYDATNMFATMMVACSLLLYGLLVGCRAASSCTAS